MPGFDGTGPAGEGPLTGRGMGPCAGRQGNGRGFGRRGMQRGWGWCPWRWGRSTPLSLEDEEKALEQELEAVRKARKEQE